MSAPKYRDRFHTVEHGLRAELPPLLRLAVPVICAELGWMSMGVVDTMLVGRVSAVAIGAVSIGSTIFYAVAIFGMGILLGRIAKGALRLDGAELLRNLYRMGVKSLPIIIVTALFTGAIMVIQAAPIVQRYGAHGLLGCGAGFGTLREIGPLLTALMISGRVGANNTAEIAFMSPSQNWRTAASFQQAAFRIRVSNVSSSAVCD